MDTCRETRFSGYCYSSSFDTAALALIIYWKKEKHSRHILYLRLRRRLIVGDRRIMFNFNSKEFIDELCLFSYVKIMLFEVFTTSLTCYYKARG